MELDDDIKGEAKQHPRRGIPVLATLGELTIISIIVGYF